jgi:hypothetical protein
LKYGLGGVVGSITMSYYVIRWSSVQGIVTISSYEKCATTKDRRGMYHTTLRPNIHYTYSINNVTYENHIETFCLPESDTMDLIKSFPRNAVVSVYFKPEQPLDNFIINDEEIVKWSDFFIVLAGLLICFASW